MKFKLCTQNKIKFIVSNCNSELSNKIFQKYGVKAQKEFLCNYTDYTLSQVCKEIRNELLNSKLEIINY